MKILVFGAGPLGSLIAVRLHEAGKNVYILDRDNRLKELQNFGVVIREEGSDKEEVTHVKIVKSFDPGDYYDLVMIIMRKNQVDMILETLAKNEKVPTFLFMGNNVTGPEELIKKLGKDRVMLGFPLPGGKREGHAMRVMTVNEIHTYTLPIGEVDGRTRERTYQVAEVLGSMKGYKIKVREDMENWLKYHAAILMPGFVPAIYAADNNMKRLGNTPDLLVLAVRATKEALHGLRKAGIPPTPGVIRIFEFLPEPMLVSLVGILMRMEYAKSSVEGHPKDARDEMEYLHKELMAILNISKVKTEAINQLSIYFDPKIPRFPEGSNKIHLNWKGLIIPSLAILGLCSYLIIKPKNTKSSKYKRLSGRPN